MTSVPYSGINDGIIQQLSVRLAHVAVPWEDTAATQPRTHTQAQRLCADDNGHGNGGFQPPRWIIQRNPTGVLLLLLVPGVGRGCCVVD